MNRHLIRTAGAAVMAGIVLAGCGSGGEESDTAAKTAPTITWDESAGITLPVSPQAGPESRSPVPSGYEQSPLGAALAAIHGEAALATASDSRWSEVVNTVAVPGPGRDEFAAARAVVSIKGGQQTDHPPAFVGYRVRSYRDQVDPMTAAVDVLTKPAGQEQLYTYPVAMAWEGDDWRIVLPVSDDNIDAEIATDTSGYTMFEGQPQ